MGAQLAGRLLFCCLLAAAALGIAPEDSTWEISSVRLDFPGASNSTYGGLFAVGQTLFMPVFTNVNNTKLQSYLYGYNYEMKVTGSLNLTSISGGVQQVGDGAFGVLLTNSVYFAYNNQLFKINATTLQITSNTTLAGVGELINGFSNSQGSQLIFFFTNSSGFNGFVTIDSNTLTPTGIHQFEPPSPYIWAYYPLCQVSQTEKDTAYCFQQASNFVQYELFTLKLNLQTFVSMAVSNATGSATVVAPTNFYETGIAFWSVSQVSEYVGQLELRTLSAFNWDMEPLWSVELPQAAFFAGIQLAGDAILVSISDEFKSQFALLLAYNATNSQPLGTHNVEPIYFYALQVQSAPPPMIVNGADRYLYTLEIGEFQAGTKPKLARFQY